MNCEISLNDSSGFYKVRIMDAKQHFHDMVTILQIEKQECLNEIIKYNGKLNCFCHYKQLPYYGAAFFDRNNAERFVEEFVNPKLVLLELTK